MLAELMEQAMGGPRMPPAVRAISEAFEEEQAKRLKAVEEVEMLFLAVGRASAALSNVTEALRTTKKFLYHKVVGSMQGISTQRAREKAAIIEALIPVVVANMHHIVWALRASSEIENQVQEAIKAERGGAQ